MKAIAADSIDRYRPTATTVPRLVLEAIATLGARSIDRVLRHAHAKNACFNKAVTLTPANCPMALPATLPFRCTIALGRRGNGPWEQFRTKIEKCKRRRGRLVDCPDFTRRTVARQGREPACRSLID
jgi:hypothetical protein